jgi:hypothetical protein
MLEHLTQVRPHQVIQLRGRNEPRGAAVIVTRGGRVLLAPADVVSVALGVVILPASTL